MKSIIGTPTDSAIPINCSPAPAHIVNRSFDVNFSRGGSGPLWGFDLEDGEGVLGGGAS